MMSRGRIGAPRNQHGWLDRLRPSNLENRIGWKAQLNVRNIGVQDRLVPMTAAPDGSIDTYRIGAGMGWSLTNSFTY